MVGAVIMIVILVLSPVFIAMGCAVVAALLGSVLKTDRDAAHEGSEHLQLSESNPYQG
jgi:hypothetical protein